MGLRGTPPRSRVSRVFLIDQVFPSLTLDQLLGSWVTSGRDGVGGSSERMGRRIA